MRPIKILVLLLLLTMSSASWAANYPEIGVCRGTNIRLKQFPGPKGKVAGYLNTGRHIVILSESTVDGQVWYKADHPMKKGNVWLPASYVYRLHQNAETEEEFVGFRLKFGMTPEKARILMGSPLKAETKHLDYEGLKLWYDNDRNLERVEISDFGYSVGGVGVGSTKDALHSLGMSGESGEVWTLKSKTGEEIEFRFDGGHVSRITWRRNS